MCSNWCIFGIERTKQKQVYAIDFNIGRAYSRSLLGANIAPNLVPCVLKKIYIHQKWLKITSV